MDDLQPRQTLNAPPSSPGCLIVIVLAKAQRVEESQGWRDAQLLKGARSLPGWGFMLRTLTSELQS